MAERGCASGFWDIITNSADAYLEKGLRHLPTQEEGASLNPRVDQVFQFSQASSLLA